MIKYDQAARKPVRKVPGQIAWWNGLWVQEKRKEIETPTHLSNSKNDAVGKTQNDCGALLGHLPRWSRSLQLINAAQKTERTHDRTRFPNPRESKLQSLLRHMRTVELVDIYQKTWQIPSMRHCRLTSRCRTLWSLSGNNIPISQCWLQKAKVKSRIAISAALYQIGTYLWNHKADKAPLASRDELNGSLCAAGTAPDGITLSLETKSVVKKRKIRALHAKVDREEVCCKGAELLALI